MAFSGHDEITIWYGPQLPGSIVTSSGYNILFGVVAETSDWHQMSLECFEVAQVWANSLKGFIE